MYSVVWTYKKKEEYIWSIYGWAGQEKPDLAIDWLGASGHVRLMHILKPFQYSYT